MTATPAAVTRPKARRAMHGDDRGEADVGDAEDLVGPSASQRTARKAETGG